MIYEGYIDYISRYFKPKNSDNNSDFYMVSYTLEMGEGAKRLISIYLVWCNNFEGSINGDKDVSNNPIEPLDAS